MKNLFLFVAGFTLLCLPGCRLFQPTYTQVPGRDLLAICEPGHPRLPLISAHRGGGGYPGYPENCLESFQYLIKQAPMLIECDVRMSVDSVLFLLHDRRLERTTTGKGQVDTMRWSVLNTLKLKDNSGTLTAYKIPTLTQALRWAKGKAILTLDVKRGVPYQLVVQAMQQAKAQGYAAVITYRIEDAVQVYQLDSTIAISVGIRSQEDLNRLESAGLPRRNLLAFTGTSLCESEVYGMNHASGIPNLLGTLGNLDREAKAKGDSLYLRWREFGVDIIATDRPVEVGRILGVSR